ncbi:hypothetical protein BU17DRAFT_60201 [Hysterangium stoloniferum]|nr:hypothetical protein BU17DRAFT_60201 [Hysterangium stoloniferum]
MANWHIIPRMLISRATPHSSQCTNAQGDSVECPPKVNTTLIIPLVLVTVLLLLGIVGLFLWRVFRGQQIRKYGAVRQEETNQAFTGEDGLEKSSKGMIESRKSRSSLLRSVEPNETCTPPKTVPISEINQADNNRKEAELHYGYAIAGL